MLGAYDGDEMVGFSAAMLGREKNHLYLFSQLTGVKATHRNGVGYGLKMEQREHALADGIDMIRWTFDPLQPSNGYFNFHKLRATASKFDKNLYGTLGGSQNLGLASDRLTADWELSKNPSTVPLLDTIKCINSSATQLGLCDEFLSMRIPADFKRIRAEEPQLASQWQDTTREIIDTYLPRYVFVDAARTECSTFYIMQRR